MSRLLLAVFLLSPLWCEDSSLHGQDFRIGPRKISPELSKQKIQISRLSHPTRIHVSNAKTDEVAIPIVKSNKTDDFVVGLWYLFKTPDLLQIVLSYLDPEQLTWCVEPNTFISAALTKQYKKELYRIGFENSIPTNQFFSCENMMLLAMTNRVFNAAFREVQVVQDHEDFKFFKDYIKVVHSEYNIWREIYNSVDVHEQMEMFFDEFLRFREIPHDNRLLRIARNNVRFSHISKAIESNKIDLRLHRKIILYGVIWIALTFIYAELYVTYLTNSPAWLLFAIFFYLFVAGVVAIIFGFFPHVYSLCTTSIKIRKLLNKNEFVKIGETLVEQEKLVKSLLFLDNP